MAAAMADVTAAVAFSASASCCGWWPLSDKSLCHRADSSLEAASDSLR